MGTSGCLPVAISGRHRARTSWTATNQIAADRKARPRRMGITPETEMDAVEYLQSLRGEIRSL
jgi:hypothetical protein